MGAITGGQIVYCALCGKHVCRETFWAEDTNYAEAFRLATAFAWHHEHSEPHRAALSAFHGDDAPRVTKEEELLAAIFERPLPTEGELRRRAARAAALAIARKERGA